MKSTGSKQALGISLLMAAFTMLLVFYLPGCASGPEEKYNKSTLVFTLKVSDRGEIDSSDNGYYAILLNSFAEEIEVTNYETFTDFIRYDGFNFTWYHRQGNVPSPGYTWVDAGNMNADGIITGDNTSIVIRIDMNDSTTLFNQYIESKRFTVHALTTDRDSSLLGRALDTLGQGPAIDGNTLYTIFFDKSTGIVDPEPPGYPSDPLDDYSEKDDLGSSYPYDNFDIEEFTVERE